MKYQPPKGTRDLIGEDGRKFQKVIEIVRNVYEKYGFEPWFTPAFESFELLSAKGGLGEDVKNEIYYFKDKADRELGLRFDLTMPLARIVVSRPEIPKPIKRYSIAPVWRYDNPQAMRWREFWQADIDIIGSKTTLADAECLAAATEALERLGFDEFKIRINNRKTLDDLFSFVPKEKRVKVFRIIDKIDKIGVEGVRIELDELNVNSEKILELILLNEEEALEVAKEKNGIEEILEVYEYAKEYGYLNKLKFDLSLVRGLDYYTGLVFEIYMGKGVSFGGGGRYDNLIKTLGGQDLPATGISLGISRIFEEMKVREMFKTEPRSWVFVAYTERKLINYAIKIATSLRERGIKTEIDLSGKKLSSQLEYADKIKVPWVVIVGEKELKENKYKLKNMNERKEEEVTFDEIIERVSKC